MKLGDPARYRLGDAAEAIGGGPGAEQRIKNWLHRYKDLDLHGARPEKGGWRRFTEADIFVLALAAQLIKFGCPIPVAFREARTTLGSADLETLKDLPDEVFAAETDEGWVIEKDEKLLWAIGARGPTILKINVPMLFAPVRTRLLGRDVEDLAAEFARREGRDQ